MTSLTKRENGTPGFSTIRQDSAPQKLKINPHHERITSVLGPSSALEGALRFNEGVKIDGSVKGDVAFGLTDGLCIVSAGALVEGNLRGPRALILGEVQGNVEVQTTLVLAPSAVVVGSVKCGSFVVYDGASVTGSIETIRQARPTVEPELDQAEPAVSVSREVLPFHRLFGNGKKVKSC